MLTVKQTARKLSVSKMSIYRWIKNGELIVYKLGKQAIRISEEDLDTFINQRRNKMPEEREHLCRKCESWGGEIKCVEGNKEFTIGKCENPDWDGMITGKETVIECPSFKEKK